MLRTIRICLSVVSITLVTLLLLGIGFKVHLWAGWVAKIQFLPALLAMNFGVLALLIVATLLFGRLYCSVVCPLGIMQDFFSWLGGKVKKRRFGFVKENRWLRYGFLAVFVIAMVIGFAPLTTVFAPYGAYGRIVNSLFKPLYDLLHNRIARLDAANGGYGFSEVQIWTRSVTTFVVALSTLLLLAVVAWRKGRLYCNTICPVGTVLGLLSRFAIFRVRLDASHCKQCCCCEAKCKAQAIDFKNGYVDTSRCVVCGDCIGQCKSAALRYSARRQPKEKKPIDTGRRAFLTATVIAGATAAMAQTRRKVDGGLAVIEDKQAPKRDTLITPPGSVGIRHLERHCTACQLCVTACPNNVLRPSTGLGHFMQPMMSFERGYCRPECTRCSQVCPTGAIKPISREEKTSIHVGHAVWLKDNCVVLTDGVRCGNCARHCPTGAIQMMKQPGAKGYLKVPVVDEERCIGCGACEHLCPARPFSAIYVEGNQVHHIN